MSNIRVGYSGLIALAVSMISILTSLIFIMILTRSLSAEDFGTWGIILSLITYGLILEPTISFWTTREIARGVDAGKTSLISSMLISILAVLVYLIASYFVGNSANVNQEILFIGIILMPIIFVKNSLFALVIGWKPHLSSYSLLLVEITKVVFVLIFVHFLEMAIFGIIVAIAIANLGSILFLVYVGRKKIQVKFQFKILKKWLRNSWYTLYTTGGSSLVTLDVLVFVLISDSTYLLAFYITGLTVSKIAGNASAVASATYSKLLSGSKGRFLDFGLTRLFYFMIPLAMISIFFSKQSLFILNPIYAESIIIVPIITIGICLNSINVVLSGYIFGIDRVDANPESTFRDFISSKLFKVRTFQFVLYTAYIISLILGLIIIEEFSNEPMDLVLFWSIIFTITNLSLTIYMTIITKKNFQIKLEKFSIIKYTVFGIFSFLLFSRISENFINYNESVIELILKMGFFVLCGCGVYLIITYLTDKSTKSLVTSIINELKLKKK